MRPNQTTGAHALALLRNTGADGQVDVLGYEADRLVMLNQVVGGVDTQAVVADMLQSPAWRDASGNVQTAPLIQAIGARLSDADRGNFKQDLDKAGIDQGVVDRAGQALAHAGSQIQQSVASAQAQLSDAMASARRQLGADPASSLHAVGSKVVEAVQERYGAQRGAVSQAGDAVVDAVDTIKLGYRFATDESFRGVLIGAAKVYAAATLEDPSKPFNDVRTAALGAIDNWQKGAAAAAAQGREAEYHGKGEGVAAFEAAMLLMPAAKLGKLSRLATALDRSTPDGAAALGEFAGDALGGIGKGGVAGRLSAEGLDLVMDAYRQQGGRLNAFVQAARTAGHLDELLEHGKLAPKELTTLATRNPEVFANVPFETAWDASLKNLGPVAAMSPKMRYGDLGEAIITRDLQRQGYTDLYSIQNNSGWGVDIAGRNPATGGLEFVEVKASTHGRARGQSGDPGGMITRWLEKAEKGAGHWAPHNMEPGMAQVARGMLDEIDGKEGRLITHWARVNLSNDTSTGALIIDKNMEPWLPPQLRPAANKNGLETPPEPQAGITPPVGKWGDPAVNDVLFALHSHDELAVDAALKRLMATPEARTVQEQGRHALAAMEATATQAVAQTTELAPDLAVVAEVEVRRGPVLSLLHPRLPEGGAHSEGSGGGDGGGGA